MSPFLSLSPHALLLAALSLSSTTPRPAPVPAAPPLRWVVDSAGNEARYRVREQLASFDFPNDAVGATRAITGAIEFDTTGAIVAARSRFVVDLRPLTSDQARRDRYLQRRTLQTDSFPTAVLVPSRIVGLGAIPPSGTATFELIGDLTIRRVTRPTTWSVTARFADGAIAGTATTAFNFTAFSLDVPSVASVLSIDDNIRLEYDFRLVPDAADAP